MAVDLHRILCCKAPWPPHQHHQDLVHHLVPVINISVMDRMAGRSLQRLLFSFFLKDPVGNRHGLLAADPHNADAGISHGCGNGRNGIRMNHTLLLFQGIFPQLSSFIIAQRGCPRQPLLIFLYAFTLPDFCCGPVWAVFPCALPFLRRSPHGGTALRPRFL